MSTLSLAILGSTNGTMMQKLIAAILQRQLDARIRVVISNQPHAGILERAKRHQLPAYFVDPKPYSRAEYDQVLSQKMMELGIDLIVLIGYMRILTPSIVHCFRHQMINVHPSLLPNFAGKMDRAVHQAVLDSGVAETGCTVHFVTEVVDEGPIIVQKKCRVFPQDTLESLRQRVQALEGDALIEAIQIFKSGQYEPNRNKASVDLSIQ